MTDAAAADWKGLAWLGGCCLIAVTLAFGAVVTAVGEVDLAGLSPAVRRGQRLWLANNCAGCHQLRGTGAYFAPELAGVQAARGSDFVAAVLRAPDAVLPPGRGMVRYGFAEAEIADLVALLAWAGSAASPSWAEAGR